MMERNDDNEEANGSTKIGFKTCIFDNHTSRMSQRNRRRGENDNKEWSDKNVFDKDNENDNHDNNYDDNRLFEFSMIIAMIFVKITLMHTSM